LIFESAVTVTAAGTARTWYL